MDNQPQHYPYLVEGDTITLTTTFGIDGLTGTVVDVDLDDDGRLRCLSLEVEEATTGEQMLLRIAGPAIALWRQGAPVRTPVPQGLAIPNGIPQLHQGLPPQLRRGPGG